MLAPLEYAGPWINTYLRSSVLQEISSSQFTFTLFSSSSLRTLLSAIGWKNTFREEGGGAGGGRGHREGEAARGGGGGGGIGKSGMRMWI